MKATIVELHQMQRKFEQSCIDFVAEYAPQSLAKSTVAIREGRAFIVRHRDAIVACTSLPDISDEDYDGHTAKIAPPIIRHDFDGFGLACLLLPLPVVHSYFYFPEFREIQLRNPPKNLHKAMANLGFSDAGNGNWVLPTRRANRSAAELLKVCGRLISTIQGSQGRMRVINRNSSQLLVHANRGALAQAARLPENVNLTVDMSNKAGESEQQNSCDE